MSTTRDQRIYAMYRAMKKRGEFHYGYDNLGQSPYYRIARAFKMPIIQVKGIITEMKQRRVEQLMRKSLDRAGCWSQPAAVQHGIEVDAGWNK